MARQLAFVVSLACGLLLATRSEATVLLIETGTLPAPIHAEQMVYSAPSGKLALRNSASAIAIVDAGSGVPLSTRLANSAFTDLSLTPDQQVLYAADYGGTNIGYGTPADTQYVHRYDLSTDTWDIRTTPAVAYHVEAVDADHLILAAIDQWITFSFQEWGSGPSAIPLGNSVPGPFQPGYWAGVYRGDVEFDASTGRLIHGNSGSSSHEIRAFRITGDDFVEQEASGTYGSAQDYGGTAVLSTDDRFFYYGRLQVDALDVTHNVHPFDEDIIAATDSVALAASGNYYDALSGALLGNLGFETAAVAVSDGAGELWAYDATDSTLHRFDIVPLPAPGRALLVLTGGLVLAVARRQRRS